MQQPDPQPTDPQARLRLARHVALQKPALRSFTPFRTSKAEPNCAQDAFSDDPKDHSPCAPAQNGADSAVSPLHLSYPRSGTRPLVIGPRHRGLPEGIVETLIQNSDEANLALFSSGLTTGQSVRILSGPFANFVGQLERLDAADVFACCST